MTIVIYSEKDHGISIGFQIQGHVPFGFRRCQQAEKARYHYQTRKAIAEVIPYDSEQKDIPLKDTVTFIEDIISPVAEEDWEILK